MPSNKAKGSRVERELLRLFTEQGWRAARVAGSGVNDDSPCDLIAGKHGRKGFAVEVKSSKKTIIYITKAQIEDFLIFSQMMGLKPAVAARFNREGWLFIDPKYMRDTGNNWAIDLTLAQEKGQRFSQFFEN